MSFCLYCPITIMMSNQLLWGHYMVYGIQKYNCMAITFNGIGALYILAQGLFELKPIGIIT